MLDDTDSSFLHLCVNSETDLEQLKASFRDDNTRSRKEVRLSIGDGSFLGQPTGSVRTRQLVSMLQTLFAVETSIEKITFDSGVSGDSNLLPLEAIAVVLQDGSSLTRLDLSYVKVVCPRIITNHNNGADHHHPMRLLQQSLLRTSSSTSTTPSLRQCCLDQALLVESHQRDASILRQCCLDRALLVEAQSEQDGNGNPPPPFAEQEEEEFTTLPLDLLISLVVHGCPHLEWLTVCAEDFGPLKIETLRDLTQAAPNLQELMLWNFDLRAATHTTAYFQALATNRNSSLVRLTFPTTLSLSGAQAVAHYLKQLPAPGRTLLQGLTLTVNDFVHDDENDTMKQDQDESTTGNGTDGIIQDESMKQNIVGVIVDALRVNQSLQSFRLRGSAKLHTARIKHTFANMLRHNYTLQYFSILNSDSDVIATTTNTTEDDGGTSSNTGNDNNIACMEDSTANIELYLKLNRYGRRNLFHDSGPTARQSSYRPTNDKSNWLDVMSETRNDLNCLFYLLQTNPSLCSGAR